VAYDKDTKSVTINEDGETTANGSTSTVTDGSAVLFADVDGEYKVYNIRNLNTVKVAYNTVIKSVAKNGKVLAAFVTLTDRPSNTGTNSTVYAIVTAANGYSYVDGSRYLSYTAANNNGTYTMLMGTADEDLKLTAGQLVSFAPATDNIYANSDVEVYAGTDIADYQVGLATWVKEYNAADKTLTYWTGIDQTGENAFTGTSGTEKTVALDDNVVIAYVDADEQAGGSEIGVSAFDPTTGNRNVLLIRDSATTKIVAIIVESSREADILGTGVTVSVDSANTSETWAAANTTSDKVTFNITSDVADDTVAVAWFDSEGESAEQPTNVTVTGNGSLTLTDGEGTLVMKGNGTPIEAGTVYYFTISVNGLTYYGSLKIGA
jgi:hypothetical protein